MKRRLIISLLTIFLFFEAKATQLTDRQAKDTLQLNTITTAVPFLLISPDSRFASLGDAGVAGTPDASSIYWDMAKSAFIKKDMGAAISYVPWLRKLVPDISLSYLSFYKKLNPRTTFAASLRYFSLGNITFTDQNGQTIGQFKPNEYAITAGVGQKFSDYISGGFNVKYIHSNLTGGITANNIDTKAGQSVAVDISSYYHKEDMTLAKSDFDFAAGINISNIGAKMAYTNDATKDFLPTNLKIGQSSTLHLDEDNKLTLLLDFNKLLVPSPPLYISGTDSIAAGKDPNVGVATGIFQSFHDAPGQPELDKNGDPIIKDGHYIIKKGSSFKEELREIDISSGLEYSFKDRFFIRGGYFYENATKGDRKYFTLGAGLALNVFSIDFSYLIATTQQNPLENTVRFTLKFDFDAFKNQNSKQTPQAG